MTHFRLTAYTNAEQYKLSCLNPDHCAEDIINAEKTGSSEITFTRRDESTIVITRTRGGGKLSNTPTPVLTLANTNYLIEGTFIDGTQTNFEIDNDNNAFKYTGEGETITLMAAVNLETDDNADQEIEIHVYINDVDQGMFGKRGYSKGGVSGSFTLLGRIDVVTNDLVTFYAHNNIDGATITIHQLTTEFL